MSGRVIFFCMYVCFFAVVETIHAQQDSAKETVKAAISWVTQSSGTDADLRGVSAVDAKVCWASGSKGTVLRTIDGGKTWKKITLGIPSADSMNFRDIEAFGKNVAIIMSITEPAKLFKTTDGGSTWTEIYGNDVKGMFFDAIVFADQNNGFAVGDPVVDSIFFVLSTGDAGKTWQQVSKDALPKIVQGEAAFAASGTCMAMVGKNNVWFCTGGPTSRVFRSADKGKTWEVSDSPLSAGIETAGGFSILFLDEKNGIIVGGDYKNEAWTEKNAAVSGDGGKTWELVADKKPSGFRECVAPVYGTKPLMVVTVGLNGSDYSLDKGKTWEPIVETTPTKGFHGVRFAKNGSGWAVGKNGLIAKFEMKK